jgi:hypothetical protein
MEHIVVGSYSSGITSYDSVRRLMDQQSNVWRQFLAKATFPLSYEAVVDWVIKMPRPDLDDVRMDVSFGDVQFLTYAANNGFYQMCFFATYEHDGSTLNLGNWLVESARNLRSNAIVLIDARGDKYPSTFGRIAVHTDRAILWNKADLSADLREIAVSPPSADRKVRKESECEASDAEELTPETIGLIHELAQEGRNSREISERLSLKLPQATIAAHVAVARRKTPTEKSD